MLPEIRSGTASDPVDRRGEVDAAAVVSQPGSGFAQGVEDDPYIGIELAGKFLVGRVLNWFGNYNTRVIDQTIDTAVLSNGRIEESFDLIGAADIRVEINRLTTGLSDGIDKRFGRLLTYVLVNDDAGPGQSLGNSGPNASGRADYKGYFLA